MAAAERWQRDRSGFANQDRKRNPLYSSHSATGLASTAMKRPMKKKKKKKPRPTTTINSSPCRPVYDPQKWNGSAHVGLNHCYNYATDVMTDNAALPGEGSGKACCSTDASVTCEKVGAAAVSDKLQATAGVTTGNPAHAHFVALALEPGGTPGRDLHRYRRDWTGFG